MSIKRKLASTQLPHPEQGFLGPGHIARPVIYNNFSATDPFILLMDDRLDKKDEEPAGGPHPHAGFETVTLMIDGEIGDGVHKMKKGDLQMMTAGSGVVHTETIDKKMKLHILQLWLTLPKASRWTLPRVQDIPLEHVPAISADGVDIRLYSGSLGGAVSPVQNYVPVIIADITLAPGASTVQQLPANFNTLLYVIDGSMKVGEEEKQLDNGHAGWLDLYADETPSELKLTAGAEGARLVLYAGKPTGESIVSHGPFIGDTSDDIIRLYKEYREGRMPHITTVPEAQQIRW